MPCLYLIRTLAIYDISKSLLNTVYRSFVESVLTFNMCTWYGHLGDKNRLSRVTNMISKITGKEQKLQGCVYKTQVKQKAPQIVANPVHPLFKEFIQLPLGRLCRAVSETMNTKNLLYLKLNLC